MGGIKRSQHHVYLPFIAGSGNSTTVRQAETKQFSKNMDQRRPFKASFYGVKVRLFPWAVLCILSQSLLFQQHSENTMVSPCQGDHSLPKTDKQGCLLPRAGQPSPRRPQESLSVSVGSNWFCWWVWCLPAGGTGSRPVFRSFKDEFLWSQFL